MFGSRNVSATSSFDLRSSRINSKTDDDDDMYAGFDDVPAALDSRNLLQDETFQEAMRITAIGKRLPSRLGTGFHRLDTSMRMGTGLKSGGGPPPTAGARPMTAVRAVGYTSSTSRTTPTLEEEKEETKEEKIKKMENRIMSLIEESCSLSVKPDQMETFGDSRTSTIASGGTTPSPSYDLGKALAKAQEASNLEKQLIRMQEQAGLSDSHNIDITFAVLFNLASQYANNEMYTEALNTYQHLTRNKVFPNANRLKVNMGNIYFKMGEHPRALKMYRMALDHIPTAEKDLRMKVMHNIGLLLVRMGKFRDAVTNFQHIMHEAGDFQTGLHLVLCQVALGDSEGARAAFHSLLEVELEVEPDEPMSADDDASEMLTFSASSDALAVWRRSEGRHAERCILSAAAAVAPMQASQDDEDGFGWCIEAIKSSERAAIAARLESRAALAMLRSAATGSCGGASVQQQVSKAGDRLRTLVRAPTADRALRAEALTNLAFISFAQGDISSCGALASEAARADPYGAGPVMAAAAATAASISSPGHSPEAEDVRRLLHHALKLDPAHATLLYYLGLWYERCGSPSEAVAWLSRARRAGGPLADLAAAALARCYAKQRDFDAAQHWYQQLLSTQPLDPGVLEDLAMMLDDSGDTVSARHCFADADAIWPCSVNILGWMGAHSDRPQKALQFYMKAARLEPNEAKWGLLIGSCLRNAGQYQEALRVYKKLWEKFPENIECLKILAKLCGDQGLPEAEQWSRELERVRRAHSTRDRMANSTSPDEGIGMSSSSARSNSGLRENSTPFSPSGSMSRSSVKLSSPIQRSPLQQQRNITTGSAGSGSRKKDFDSGRKALDFDDLPLPMD